MQGKKDMETDRDLYFLIIIENLLSVLISFSLISLYAGGFQSYVISFVAFSGIRSNISPTVSTINLRFSQCTVNNLKGLIMPGRYTPHQVL